MLNFLASRPALARLLAVDVYAAGDAAIERRYQGLRPLGVLIENNTTSWQHMPPIVYEAISGSVYRLIYKTVKESGPNSLPALAPVCTYLTLFPFIGAEDACAAANGDGSARSGSSGSSGQWSAATDSGAIPFRAPIKRTIAKALSILGERSAAPGKPATTPRAIAVEVGEEVEIVRSYLRDLASIGVLEEERLEGETEPSYRSRDRLHKLQMISSQQSAMMSPAERKELSADVWELIAADVDLAIASGIFDSRIDRYLIRTPLHVDKQGWLELTDLHEQTLHTGFEIQARSSKRMRESGETGIEARSVQLAFEMPPPAPQDDQ
jgi:hypothetical protein